MNFETHQKDLSHHPLISMTGISPGIKLISSHRNAWLDFVLVLISLTTIMTAYSNTPAHIWLAGGMTALVLVHLTFHRTWIQTTGKNIFHKKSARIWSKIILDVALLIDFLLLVFSGLIISTIYAPHITQFHNICFYTFINLLTIHLFLNRKWIAKILKQKSTIKIGDIEYDPAKQNQSEKVCHRRCWCHSSNLWCIGSCSHPATRH